MEKGKHGMHRILFQGDSITDADRTCFPDAEKQLGGGYPRLIAARLLADNPAGKYAVFNRGVSGNRVVDLYARWKTDTLALKPDLLSILIGVNDTWHEYQCGNGVEPERYAQIYDMLLEWTKKTLPRCRIVLLEPFILCFKGGATSAKWKPEIAARGKTVRGLAEKYGARFLPLQEMLNKAAKKFGGPEVLADGVHPTLLGHQLIADAWLKAVKL